MAHLMDLLDDAITGWRTCDNIAWLLEF